jgi:acyl dehydratase
LLTVSGLTVSLASFIPVIEDVSLLITDVERAKRESPFGGPVAHGNLTLSMIDGFAMPVAVLSEEDVEVSLNIGWNRVRFPAPVPVGRRVRATAELVSVEDKGKGWWEVIVRYTVEIEGTEKPACVADNVGRLQFKNH